MIKECKVLLNNDAVTVIRYGDIDVQIPAIKRNADTVKVKNDGVYTVVPDNYSEPDDSVVKPNARKRKTPVKTEED